MMKIHMNWFCSLRQADKIPESIRTMPPRVAARMLKDARLLRPRLRGVFALRALCHRGRAAPTAETPAAFARLIGGGTSRPRTRAAAKVRRRRASPTRSPISCASSGWANPPRRRRAARTGRHKKNEPTLPVVNNKNSASRFMPRRARARD